MRSNTFAGVRVLTSLPVDQSQKLFLIFLKKYWVIDAWNTISLYIWVLSPTIKWRLPTDISLLRSLPKVTTGIRIMTFPVGVVNEMWLKSLKVQLCYHLSINFDCVSYFWSYTFWPVGPVLKELDFWLGIKVRVAPQKVLVHLFDDKDRLPNLITNLIWYWESLLTLLQMLCTKAQESPWFFQRSLNLVQAINLVLFLCTYTEPSKTKAQHKETR